MLLSCYLDHMFDSQENFELERNIRMRTAQNLLVKLEAQILTQFEFASILVYSKQTAGCPLISDGSVAHALFLTLQRLVNIVAIAGNKLNIDSNDSYFHEVGILRELLYHAVICLEECNI